MNPDDLEATLDYADARIRKLTTAVTIMFGVQIVMFFLVIAALFT